MATEPTIRLAPAPDPVPADLVEALSVALTNGRVEGERSALPAVQPVATLEPLTVGRKSAAKLFSVSLATWDRWDSSGLLGPVGTVKAGRKLWLLAELREWAAAAMPCRKEWLAIKAAANASGRALQAGR
jgi:hypothetical protein